MKKVVLATSLIMGGLSASATADDVTVWAWDPNFNVAIMEEAAQAYQAKFPEANITVVDFSREEIEQKLHTMLASGITSALPDIVLIEDYSAQKYLQSYPGSFHPLTEAVDYSNFAPYKVGMMTLEGEVYGVPFDSGVTGMYYRTDILEQAGFSASDLQDITWDRYIEIGKAVKEKTGVSMLGNDPSDMGLIRVMMQSAGSWYFNADGSLNLKDNTALKDATRVFRELYASNITRPTVGWSEWVGALNSGSVASITTGVWITASVKAEPSQKGLWALAPTPRLSVEGATNSSNLGGSSWYILSASDSKDEATRFLTETYAAGSEFYQQILTGFGAVGSYIPAGGSEAYKFQDPYFADQAVYADFAKWIPQIPEVNYGMYTAEVDAFMAAQLPAIIQGAPIDDILERAEQQLAYQIK